MASKDKSDPLSASASVPLGGTTSSTSGNNSSSNTLSINLNNVPLTGPTSHHSSSAGTLTASTPPMAQRNTSTSSGKKRPTRPAPAIPPALTRPTRKPPVPPYLFKHSDGYIIQEVAENDSYDLDLQDFNFLPIYGSKIKDQPHSLFLGDSPIFGIVVVAIMHPNVPEGGGGGGKKKNTEINRKFKFPRKNVKAEDDEEEEGEETNVDVFIRGVPGDVFFSIPIKNVKSGNSKKYLIKEFQENLKDYQDTNFELVKDPQLMTDLAIFEQNLIQKKYKFGLLLRTQEVADDENAIFSIKQTTADFEEFLEFLGERVTLQGFKKYNAGLDTSANLDGTHSIFSNFRDFEIMWHVCPLLLYSDNNPQQQIHP